MGLMDSGEWNVNTYWPNTGIPLATPPTNPGDLTGKEDTTHE